MTATELHDSVSDLGSARTVYRDLQFLQEAGFPLYQDDDNRWRLLDTSEGGTSLPIQPTEIIALLLSEQVMEPLQGSELAGPLTRLRTKLISMLGPRGIEFMEKYGAGYFATLSAPGSYHHRGDDLQLIGEAIGNRTTLRILHHAAHRGETLERTVDPYGLWFSDGALYLVAFDHLRNDIRKFLVDRIRRISRTQDRFESDPEFDLQAYVGRGFRVWHGQRRRVVVEFAAEIAHLPQERRYHRTQKLEELADGRVRVTFLAAGLPDLAAWICSFGGRVRAVEPVELVAMIREFHTSGLAAHQVVSSGDVSLDDNGSFENDRCKLEKP